MSWRPEIDRWFGIDQHNNGQRRPEYIQADIERTRTDLSETLIAALERRLRVRIILPGPYMDVQLGARRLASRLRATHSELGWQHVRRAAEPPSRSNAALSYASVTNSTRR